MLSKSDEYWAEVRQVPLSKTESTMDVFMNRIEQIPGFKYIIFGAKAVIENFVETTGPKKPSKFDFGPINTTISNNYVDGLRLRLSGMTTAQSQSALVRKRYAPMVSKTTVGKYVER